MSVSDSLCVSDSQLMSVSVHTGLISMVTVSSVPAPRGPRHMAVGGSEGSGQPPGGAASGHRPAQEPPRLRGLLLPPYCAAPWVTFHWLTKE